MMINANEFANTIQENAPQSSVFRMATVTQVSSGNAYLTFYGEETQRIKSYKHLASYTPAVNDVVLCAKINNTYTILGRVI